MQKRIFAAILAAFLLIAPPLRVHADESAPGYSYVLMEGGTRTLLYSDNGEAEFPAHHSAKLMTLLLTAEAIERGELSLDTVLKTSDHANSMQGAQIWLMPGEEITVDELISSITVGNANDASVVLAEALGHTEAGFVDMMNQKADSLGMSGTHYADCTGISRETVTTACDAALLASELSDHTFLRGYLTTWLTSVRGGRTELASTNRLILSYDGVIGMKAYFSEDTGNCVIAAAERNGLIMVCVIFGEQDEFERFSTAKEKMNTGFNAYSLCIPRRSDIYTEPVSVSGGEVTEVETELGDLSDFVIRKSAEDKLKITVEYFEDIKAPLKKGDAVGRAVYSADGEEIYSCKVTAKRSVRKMNIFLGILRAFRAILRM